MNIVKDDAKYKCTYRVIFIFACYKLRHNFFLCRVLTRCLLFILSYMGNLNFTYSKALFCHILIKIYSSKLFTRLLIIKFKFLSCHNGTYLHLHYSCLSNVLACKDN